MGKRGSGDKELKALRGRRNAGQQVERRGELVAMMGSAPAPHTHSHGRNIRRLVDGVCSCSPQTAAVLPRSCLLNAQAHPSQNGRLFSPWHMCPEGRGLLQLLGDTLSRCFPQPWGNRALHPAIPFRLHWGKLWVHSQRLVDHREERKEKLFPPWQCPCRTGTSEPAGS